MLAGWFFIFDMQRYADQTASFTSYYMVPSTKHDIFSEFIFSNSFINHYSKWYNSAISATEKYLSFRAKQLLVYHQSPAQNMLKEACRIPIRLCQSKTQNNILKTISVP